VTRLLDLNAGDTVQLYCYHNKSSSTTLNNGSQAPCRLILQWMGALGTPSTLWANPDPGYRWQAGDPNLVSDFNTHLVNDLGFLVNRPYLLTYQATAQTGVADNSNQLVVTDSATGQVHASVGDNYSGWTSGSSNQYTCQRAGWYLVVGSFVIAHIGTGATTTSLLASAFAAGLGYNQANNYDGQQLHTTSGALSPGADVVRVIYMGVSDTISFNMNVSGSTFNTSVNNLADQTSHFGLVWLGQ
jgi:hypothetical protein